MSTAIQINVFGNTTICIYTKIFKIKKFYDKLLENAKLKVVTLLLNSQSDNVEIFEKTKMKKRKTLNLVF